MFAHKTARIFLISLFFCSSTCEITITNCSDGDEIVNVILGESVIIHCTGLDRTRTVVWAYKLKTESRKTISCQRDTSLCGSNNRGTATIDGETSTLSLQNVSPTGKGSVICSQNNAVNQHECRLNVYEPGTVQSCTASPNDNGKTIEFLCKVVDSVSEKHRCTINFDNKTFSYVAPGRTNGDAFTCEFSRMKPAASNIYTYTIYVAPDEVSYNGSVNFDFPTLEHNCPNVILQGTEITCTCSIATQGYFPSTVKWTSVNTNTLTKTITSTEDISCSAYWGENAVTNKTYSPTLVDRPSELTLNIEEGQVHQIGESLSVTCALGTRQHWNKFSLTLQCGDLSGTRTENNNNLEISPLTVNHNDVECNCFASWRADQLLYSATRTGTLKVKLASDVKLFSASTIDSDVTVVEGDQVAFLCRCEGFPIPSMEIVDLHGVVMKPLVQAVNTELSIERQVNHVVSCYGTGQYLCKCENTHSVSNSTLNVTVNCAPKFLKSVVPPSFLYTEKPISHTFRFEANPVPSLVKVELLKGTDTIQTDKVKVTCQSIVEQVSSVKCSFYIENVGPDDAGLYRIMFRNQQGTLTYEFHVQLDGVKNSTILIIIVVAVVVCLICLLPVSIHCIRRRRASRTHAMPEIKSTEIDQDMIVNTLYGPSMTMKSEKRPAKPFVEDSLEMSNAFTKGQPYNAKTGEVHPNKAQYPSQQLYEKQHHAGNSHGHKTNSSSGQHLQNHGKMASTKKSTHRNRKSTKPSMHSSTSSSSRRHISHKEPDDGAKKMVQSSENMGSMKYVYDPSKPLHMSPMEQGGTSLDTDSKHLHNDGNNVNGKTSDNSNHPSSGNVATKEKEVDGVPKIDDASASVANVANGGSSYPGVMTYTTLDFSDDQMEKVINMPKQQTQYATISWDDKTALNSGEVNV